MAFNNSNLTFKTSLPADNVHFYTPTAWEYTTSDTSTSIRSAQSSYFDGGYERLRKGDLIATYASDRNVLFRVEGASPNPIAPTVLVTMVETFGDTFYQ
jgi:hypothetical protein